MTELLEAVAQAIADASGEELAIAHVLFARKVIAAVKVIVERGHLEMGHLEMK